MTQELVPQETFVVAMPDQAPALGFDPQGESFSWRDVLPDNYMNLDWLEDKVGALGGNPVFTAARIIVQPVVDPEDKEPDLSPKLVMEFVEAAPALVLNKTRCTLAQRLTGTPNPSRWAELLPPLEIYAGANRDFSAALQILFRPVAVADSRDVKRKSRVKSRPGNSSAIDEANEDLFG